ncbi:hypothetical protein C8039_17695 [Halogeometricum sp. wsp3]|nr:hypothetical protein C8039_17695 [Halogeometricum sp. wsp3]
MKPAGTGVCVAETGVRVTLMVVAHSRLCQTRSAAVPKTASSRATRARFVTELRHFSTSRRRQLSKFVSGALRHARSAGFEVDKAGWTGFDALRVAVERQYDWADAAALAGVIATDPKGRFERTGVGNEAGITTAGGRVRAASALRRRPSTGPITPIRRRCTTGPPRGTSIRYVRRD